jgi:hypothetical protein
MEKKYKRKQDLGACWVILILNILSLGSWIGGWIYNGFGFDIFGFGFFLFTTLVLGALLSVVLKSREFIDYTDIVIFEFDIWDKDKMEYQRRYEWYTNELNANFTLNYHTGNTERRYTEKDIIFKYTESAFNGNWLGYTKDEVMENIKDWIKKQVIKGKSVDNIKIKSISICDTLNVEELIKNFK